jgi:hypothetical protein
MTRHAPRRRIKGLDETLAPFPSLSAPIPPNPETLVDRPSTIAAVWSFPWNRRWFHRHRHPRLVLPAKGIEQGRPIAPPASSSSPMPVPTNSGELAIHSPRRQARCVPGEPLNLIACLYCSIASPSFATSRIPRVLPLRHAAGRAPATIWWRRDHH